ncbi:MAG: DUF4395 domain-containing protein [Anaerolineales bacterium]|jgi:hypothetical protein
MASLQKVDHAALRTNQAFIIALSVLAFILNLPFMAGFVGAVMLLGTLTRQPGFAFAYWRVLKPLGWVQPDVIADNPEPHRFAQGFGSVVLLGGAVFLFLEIYVLGWILVWVVIALAALNLFGGFCVGCAMYYWLNRLKVPGFTKSPPPGTVPGMRPKMEER